MPDFVVQAPGQILSLTEGLSHPHSGTVCIDTNAVKDRMAPSSPHSAPFIGPRLERRPRMKRTLVVCGLVLCFLVFAHPALANVLTGATATVDCNGFKLTVDAGALTIATSYTINFTFTLTPTSGPPIIVPGTINFTATSSTATETISGTWPGAPLTASFTVTGSAVLTSSASTVPIIINGSTAALLTCGLDGRMTGGGSVFETDGTRVTHGFELHCDVADVPNNLEINWGPGDRFHLETLVSASCFTDPNIN